jgi:hypothetical protein
MQNVLLLLIIVCLSCGTLLNAGCTKNSGSPSEAIQSSQALQTVKEKADYLIQQANAFLNAKDYQKAIDTAQYVLNNLDKNSQPAKDLIEKAKSMLQGAAQKAVGDVSNKLLGK